MEVNVEKNVLVYFSNTRKLTYNIDLAHASLIITTYAKID